MTAIQEQFNRVAEEYDKNRRKFIPCYDDYYIHSTNFITSNIGKPDTVIDLGTGTGLLTYYWYNQYPDVKYVLVDIADEMLKVARQRFAGIENVTYQIMDYTEKLPDLSFDTVISALSIHHLEDMSKQKLFSELFERLPRGGLFVNYDQFCAGQPEMNTWFDSYWENEIYKSGLSEHDISAWKERRKLDRECSVEQEIEMLHNAGFESVKCVYSYLKYSVIVALKL